MDFSNIHASLEGTKLEALLEFCSPDYIDGLKHGDFPRWRQHLKTLPRLEASQFDPGEVIKIGSSADLGIDEKESLQFSLMQMVPWRKGPFQVFGIDIDAEWNCSLKWARLEKKLAPLNGKKILDIGCGNGYYGFRMLQQKAQLVVGIDPHLAYVAQFWALKQYLPELPVHVLPCSLEQFETPLKGFDRVFSMGVIYHRRSPLDHLLQCKDCLSPGGQLILETLYVDGPAGYSLTPDKKYARMPNVWFVPSIGTLEQWLTRCGFTNIEIVDQSITTVSEQRKTAWMPFDSLEDALDKSNAGKTIEGAPAPKRVIIFANAPN